MKTTIYSWLFFFSSLFSSVLFFLFASNFVNKSHKSDDDAVCMVYKWLILLAASSWHWSKATNKTIMIFHLPCVEMVFSPPFHFHFHFHFITLHITFMWYDDIRKLFSLLFFFSRCGFFVHIIVTSLTIFSVSISLKLAFSHSFKSIFFVSSLYPTATKKATKTSLYFLHHPLVVCSSWWCFRSIEIF